MAGYLSDSIMNDVPSSEYIKQSTQVSLSVISARIAVVVVATLNRSPKEFMTIVDLFTRKCQNTAPIISPAAIGSLTSTHRPQSQGVSGFPLILKC